MKILPPILYFDTKEERKIAIEKTYSEFEKCNIPYLAVVVSPMKNNKFELDIEIIYLTPKEAKPYIEEIKEYVNRYGNANMR